jgi:hypothetical protein
MNFRRPGFVLTALVCGATSAAGAQAARQGTAPADPGSRISFGITQSRDTVAVGDPFQIRVRVRAPAGSVIRFPDNPDTSGTVQARDPRIVQTSDSVEWLDQIATYHVAAWDVGRQSARFSDVVVTWNTPASRGERRIPLLNASVFVRSVLPADSALRVPKPARPIWEVKVFPWWLVALAAAAIAIAIWWWRRRRTRPATPLAPAVDPYDRATADLARIEAMGLVEAGERTRYVALMIEVLRDYLAARYPDARPALTSRELVALFRRRPAVSADALVRTLHDADLAKFAGLSLGEERARAVARDSRAIIDREHSASQPKPDAQAAA